MPTINRALTLSPLGGLLYTLYLCLSACRHHPGSIAIYNITISRNIEQNQEQLRKYGKNASLLSSLGAYCTISSPSLQVLQGIQVELQPVLPSTYAVLKKDYIQGYCASLW